MKKKVLTKKEQEALDAELKRMRELIHYDRGSGGKKKKPIKESVKKKAAKKKVAKKRRKK